MYPLIFSLHKKGGSLHLNEMENKKCRNKNYKKYGKGDG